jgi:hypothetical protein
VQRPRTLAAPHAVTACRPLRAVFYAASDWLRLATKLAAAPAPCAQYYISIPPLAADKTAFRADQPWRIRALGANFHALAEISTQGWANWVSANGSSWYEAGREARRRMAAAGFDVASGDTWIVNELSSAVVRGVGSARQNMRDLVRGLYDGDGSPPLKGGVFVYGMGQGTTSLATWKAYLQDWFRDSAFWDDMNRYVSDWAQEVYGDMHSYAVDGSSLDARSDALNAYMQHELTLAAAGPNEIASARGFLRAAYSPLANAAWQYSSGYGWTMVPSAQMQDYVSAQTYALRSFAATNGQALDHFGFAWAPQVPAGMSDSAFATQSGAVADRLAAAIHDSAQSADGACAPNWCSTAIAGAAFNPAWNTFTTWSPDTLALSGAASATAGTAATLTAELQVAGIAWPEASPVTVTLTTTSAGGGFAATTDGPWTHTLDVSLPAGSTDVPFAYRDTSAGTATITASAANRIAATRAVRIAPAALATLAISPASVTLAPGGTQQFTATGADAYGNAVAPATVWSIDPGTPGTVSPTGLFAAGSSAGTGNVVASAGGITARASVVVNLPATPLAQTIAFAPLPNRTFGDPDFTIAATASSGLPVSLSATGTCALAGLTVHLTGAGSCTLTAAQRGNTTYAQAPPVSRTFAVAKAGQTIAFARLAKRRLGAADFPVAAGASSNLPVSFRASGGCTVRVRRVHLVRAGSCRIIASQPGNANYRAAPSVLRTFSIAASCVVPKVLGATLANAERTLGLHHCGTGAVRQVYSRTNQKSRVVAQSARSGRVLPAGTKIGLTLGRGPRR